MGEGDELTCGSFLDGPILCNLSIAANVTTKHSASALDRLGVL